MVEGVFQETKIGTPQGGNLSPLLANIYLNELDVELTKRGLRFTRYADDVIICVRSEVAANRVMRTVTEWLEKHLRVKVNMTKTKVCKPNGLKYLGYSFFQRNGWKPKPHIKSVEKLKAKLHELTIRSKSISMESRIAKINPVIRGWVNYFWICIWKQWKTIRKRRRALMKLGAPRWLAEGLSNSRKGCMAIAKGGLGSLISAKILKLKGLLSLTDHYQEVHSY